MSLELSPVGDTMADLVGAVWTRDGRFVLVQLGEARATTVWVMNAAGAEPHRLDLPSVAGCSPTSYRSAQLLNDGRIGLVRDCWKDGTGPPVTRSSVALDLSSNEIEELAPLWDHQKYSDGVPHGALTASTVAWDQTFSKGFTDDGVGCGTLFSVDRSGVYPLDVVIGEGDRSWNLKGVAESYQPGESCARWGDAGLPKIAPDSDEVVFFASSDVLGLDGPDRLDASLDLYRMKINGTSPSRFASGFRYLSGMELSPDGRWLAIAAEYRGEPPALWLVNMKNGEVARAAEGEMRTPSWSPDGLRVAAILTKGASDPQLATVNVRPLVEP